MPPGDLIPEESIIRPPEPRHDTSSSRRTYVPAPKPGYHGPHFEKALAQEKLWDARGAKDVWDPAKPLRSVEARPETYGHAHSFHEPRVKPKYSNPYGKRPDPFTDRVRADYDSYKAPSEGHAHISLQVNAAKDIQVGRKVFPEYHHRDGLMKGKELARAGRDMANIAAQSRSGFDHKYPQAYQDLQKVGTHSYQARTQKGSANKYRASEVVLSEKKEGWKRQMGKQRGIYDL